MNSSAISVEIVAKLANYFQDYEKTYQWLIKKNRQLGGFTPKEIYHAGHAKELLSLVDQMIAERESLYRNRGLSDS